MKFINKSSVIGFTLGAIISPLIMVGGIYLYIQTQMDETLLGNHLGAVLKQGIAVFQIG